MANLTQQLDGLVTAVRTRMQSEKIASVMLATGLSQTGLYNIRAGRRKCRIDTLRLLCEHFDAKSGESPDAVPASVASDVPWEN